MILKALLSRAWYHIIEFLLPRLCCGCGERIQNEAWLVCEPCLDSIPPLILPICGKCGCPNARIEAEGKCSNCPPGTIYFEAARGVAAFTGLPQTLIHKLKYQRRIEYAPLLALQMARLYAASAAAGRSPADIIIPVPLHSTRFRDRGFNQSSLLARQFSKINNIPVSETALKRIKSTPSQTRLKRRLRRKNVAGAFACKNADAICGKRILLIDDVYTTGSTLNECARVLKEAGAGSVECLAYARAVL